jgi:hypothetical protein
MKMIFWEFQVPKSEKKQNIRNCPKPIANLFFKLAKLRIKNLKMKVIFQSFNH